MRNALPYLKQFDGLCASLLHYMHAKLSKRIVKKYVKSLNSKVACLFSYEITDQLIGLIIGKVEKRRFY